MREEGHGCSISDTTGERGEKEVLAGEEEKAAVDSSRSYKEGQKSRSN